MTPSETSVQCPRCGSSDTLEIVYGLPGPELERDALRGLVAIGGCIIEPNSPSRLCRRCDHHFGSIDRDTDEEEL